MTARVIGYDDLRRYLEAAAETEQRLAYDTDDAGDPDSAARHFGKAEAYREMRQHIERATQEEPK